MLENITRHFVTTYVNARCPQKLLDVRLRDMAVAVMVMLFQKLSLCFGSLSVPAFLQKCTHFFLD